MWYPFDDMRRFRKEMKHLFGPLWEDFDIDILPEMKERMQMRPAVCDLKETDSELVALFEIPGVDKKDIMVNVKENYLEVKAQKKRESKKEEEGHFMSSRMYRGFYKSMMLPAKVVPENVKASYRDGVLEVTMPKAEKEKKKEAKKVEVT